MSRRPLEVRVFSPELGERWDAFVRASKNGTFLFERGFMGYHADRFADHSLIVSGADGEWLALLPAHRCGARVETHGGLSYGGFVVGERMTTPSMLEVFAATERFLAAQGATEVLYKTVPHVYHRLPAEEDRYALFRAGAALVRRDVLSVIEPARRLRMQQRRQRAVRRARASGVRVRGEQSFERFWQLLTAALAARHGVTPTHSLSEITLLAARFPRAITLWIAEREDRLLAGVVVFDTPNVAHAQYIASSDEGRECGALDLLFERLLGEVCSQKRWFDFGISNEEAGQVLNVGLVEQKEGFGARAVVHDHYLWTLGGRGEA